MKLDPLDILILKELAADGRASFREIAKRASLSTPTVSSRFGRMNRAGLIRKFAPIFNLEAVDNAGILALVTMNAPPSRTDEIAKELGKMEQVYEVIVTTGRDNLVTKLRLENAQALQRFLNSPTLKKLDVKVSGSQIITATVKDEYPLPFAESFRLNLRCDLCKGEISSPRPYTIKVASTRYYFCCKTCKKDYLAKHGEAIKLLNER
ncbi:MAG: AsnC family transcriptional regulator [Thaumarchaeota archaeon]|nr:AsnC family transcriptional regulator [Nitrososphaerota archaeon]